MIKYKTTCPQAFKKNNKDSILSMPKIIDSNINNPKEMFSESDFEALVSQLLNEENIYFSMNDLLELISLKNFISDTIEYRQEFIDKLAEVLNEFLESNDIIFSHPFSNNDDESMDNPFNEGSLYISLLIDTVKILGIIWKIKRYNPVLFNETLIVTLISLVFKFNMENDFKPNKYIKEFNIESFNALINLSSYFPQLVSNFCDSDFFDLIISSISNQNSNGLQKPSLILLKTFCESKSVLEMHPELSTILPPVLINLFKYIDFFPILTRCLFLLFQSFGDVSLAVSLSNKLFSEFDVPFKNFDRSKIKDALSIISFCIDRLNFLHSEIDQNHALDESQIFIIENEQVMIDYFYCPNFVDILLTTVRQYYSVSSDVFYDLVDKMMDRMWRIFFDKGLIELIICDSDKIQFHNKINCISSITKFLEEVSTCLNEKNLEINEFCLNWGRNSPVVVVGPVDDDSCDSDDENFEKNNGNDDYFEYQSLSNWELCQCVVFGGGLSFLISMISSVKDSSLLKRIFQLIYHLISNGPPEFAQLAFDEGLLDNSDSTALGISEGDVKNDDLDHTMLIISQIFQFYHNDSSE